ncbi:MAG TPA: hypothetical protein G4N96_12880 [Chloroflexi bacterium]|nr:hypothetical protein [Chloroflexota bacterium]
MMDHVKILKRALDISWRYRALWLFGIILALTTGGGGSGGGNGGSGSGIPNGSNNGDFPRFEDFAMPEISAGIITALIAVGVGLACLFLAWVIVATIARYVAETALIKMVDHHEETGEKRSIRQGFGLGWSLTAWRFFLIDLLIGIPLVVAIIALLAITALPLLLWVTKSVAAGVLGTIATIGALFLVILLIIIVSAVVSLLTHFFRRVCALEDQGVIESIKQGFNLVKQNFKDVGIMWLLMVGVQIGWMIVLIPVVFLLLALGAVSGGLLGLMAGGLTGFIAEGAIPWIVGGAVGLPIFILIMAVPLTFVGGLFEVYKSSVWTLTYREVHVLGDLETGPEVEQLPEADAAKPEEAS